MAVQFILGRSGTGKSRYCVKAVVDALAEPGEQGLILLVPEQASYQAERAILADRRIAGYNRLNVLSFDRLQFLLSGKNTARPALTRLGQQMIVHRLLRDNGSKLKAFGSSASSVGMSRQMAETIRELHQYAKTAEDIEQLLCELRKEESNNLAALKFADIGLIFDEYLRAIEGKFTDPDAQLRRACGAVGKADSVKGARLWVDGFAGFTTAELAILAELLKTAADAQIALCLDASKVDLGNPDAGRGERFGLFGPTEETYAALFEIVKNSKLELREPIILNTAVRFSGSGQLAHIERNIFEPAPAKIAARENIRIVSAPNARAEVQFVARQILGLVKEKGYRYRDIAVIASDIARYEHYIRAYFEDYGIPFFIDRRKGLKQHAAVQLICSALEVVSGGFCHHDIFSYLKSDLVPVERGDVDLLENYCLAFGVGAADWQSDKEWQFAGEEDESFDERRINQIRRKLSGPLLGLRERLYGGDNAAKTVRADELTEIISDFLDSLEVRQRIGEWLEEAVKAGNYTAADEHRQFYDKFVSVFDELVEVFGGQKIKCEDYLAIVNSAFSQLTLAFIPPSLDQVLVGSIERSRHPDLKAVFLIGATQRQFPVPVSFGGILSDEDRRAAESADFALAATGREKLVERQYLAYIAFTRASEFLCVTYPLVDEKGSGECRSQFIGNLESLFEDLGEESIAGEQISVDKIVSESELADLLCRQLGKDSPGDVSQAWRDEPGELLDECCGDEQLAEVGSRVFSAINYDNCARLDSDVVENLFGKELRSSATRLSTFAACPYQYFARYVLELKERKEFKFEPLDLGRFYHRVLDGLLRKLNAEKKDIATAQNGELLKLLREQIAELVQTDRFISNFAGRSVHNAFIINAAGEVLEDCVPAIAEMVRAGSFRPERSEVSFGEVKDAVETLGEYKMELLGGRALSLDGKIDRVDIANVSGKITAIVLDYKRRAKSFSWSELYYGLDMQLAIYMLATHNAAGAGEDVVGAFYMPVEVSPKASRLDGLSLKAESFDYKARGIFNGDFAQQLDGENRNGENKFYNFYVTKNGEPYGNYENRGALKPNDFEKVLKFTEVKIIELAEEILSGRIEVRPYRLSQRSPCSYCKYKSVCRFDWQINDYNSLESLRKSAVLEKMGAGDG